MLAALEDIRNGPQAILERMDESLPLDGFVVGVTADRRAEEQSEMLRRRGAQVLNGPTIRTLPLGADDGLRAATESLVAHPPDVVIANTGIGVRGWFAAAESWGLGDGLAHALTGSRILARGPKAAGAILTAGLTVAWRAPSETLAEVVGQLTSEAPLAGVRVALQLDGNVEQLEATRLRAAGADVVEVPVYHWTLPLDSQPAHRLIDAACGERLDAITFTNAGAVHNLFELAAERDRGASLRDAMNKLGHRDMRRARLRRCCRSLRRCRRHAGPSSTGLNDPHAHGSADVPLLRVPDRLG